jgi:hypothetical protein
MELAGNCWECWALIALGSYKKNRHGCRWTAHPVQAWATSWKNVVSIESALLEVREKSIHMLHKMVHDVSLQVAAVTVVIEVHIDANTRKAIQLPEDVRQRGNEMKQQEMAAFEERISE